MFKVKTTSQESYYVRPNLGIITARSARSVTFIFRKPLGGEVSISRLSLTFFRMNAKQRAISFRCSWLSVIWIRLSADSNKSQTRQSSTPNI